MYSKQLAMHCHACHKPLTITKIGFQETCPHCMAWLHCCQMCHAFDAQAERCTEPQAEAIRDTAHRNLCDWFKATDRGSPSNDDEAQQSRERLAKLFGVIIF